MLYRILTEDLNREDIVAIASQYFPSFTLLDGTGYWNGTAERCLIIEVDGHESNIAADVLSVADRIKKQNEQEAVLVQRVPSDTMII